MDERIDKAKKRGEPKEENNSRIKRIKKSGLNLKLDRLDYQYLKTRISKMYQCNTALRRTKYESWQKLVHRM